MYLYMTPYALHQFSALSMSMGYICHIITGFFMCSLAHSYKRTSLTRCSRNPVTIRTFAHPYSNTNLHTHSQPTSPDIPKPPGNAPPISHPDMVLHRTVPLIMTPWLINVMPVDSCTPFIQSLSTCTFNQTPRFWTPHNPSYIIFSPCTWRQSREQCTCVTRAVHVCHEPSTATSLHYSTIPFLHPRPPLGHLPIASAPPPPLS